MFKIIDRYIAKTILVAIAMVTLMLIGLQIFILFVGQIDNIGQGNFGIWQALIYVLMQTPYQVYLFFPVASLLGALIGLGSLASNSELIVMRAAGFSIGQIITAVLKSAMVLIVLVSVLGETVIPDLTAYSNSLKMLQKSGSNAIQTNQGMWIRNGENFINIGKVTPDKQLLDVIQYAFNAQHMLYLVRAIDVARFEHDHWNLTGVKESWISGEKVVTKDKVSSQWNINLNPELLGVAQTQADEMNILELKQMVDARKQNKQDASDYRLALWQRLIQPFTTCVMMFLAIPFIFGPLREASMGSRLVSGAMVGFGFHMVNKFFGPVSLVFQLSPIVGACGPTLLFLLIAFLMMRRVH